MHWKDRIVMKPGVLGGKPIIRGYRISVEQILDHLASRWTYQDILENYPFLVAEDLDACMKYANEFIKRVRVDDASHPQAAVA